MTKLEEIEKRLKESKEILYLVYSASISENSAVYSARSAVSSTYWSAEWSATDSVHLASYSAANSTASSTVEKKRQVEMVKKMLNKS